jgi:hypothetical protein
MNFRQIAFSETQPPSSVTRIVGANKSRTTSVVANVNSQKVIDTDAGFQELGL